MKEGTAKEKINLARRLISDVVVISGKIQLSLIRAAVQTELLGEIHRHQAGEAIVLEERFTIARRGGEARLTLSDEKDRSGEPIPSLIGAIVQARTWAEWIISGKVVTLEELARKAGRSQQYATRILRLAALSPKVADAILSGDHSRALTVPELTSRFPLSWEQQGLPS